MMPMDKINESQTNDKNAETVDSTTMLKGPADKYIWAIYIALCIISIIELYSASSREVTSANIYGPILRHCGMLFGGFLILLYLQNLPYQRFIPWIPVFVIISIVMAIYVLFFGDIVNGARRSFTILGITIQSAEFLKISAVLSIAFILSRTQSKHKVKNMGLVMSASIVLLFGGLLFKQGLTNTILLMSISISMMLIGGVQIKKVAVICVIYIVLAGISYATSHNSTDKEYNNMETIADNNTFNVLEKTNTLNRTATREHRLKEYFSPDIPKIKQDVKDSNRQEQYSYMAQAHGGLLGVGPGYSRESARLPLAFTDYIYAIIIEELGLIGGLFVLVLYLWLIVRTGSIARACSRAFPALLVMGMAIFIVFQALFHMAIVTGVFPVSGEPLPLISKGGSSILVTSIAFGVMLSVSRYATRNGKRQDIKEEINALPESMRGENLTQLQL